MTLLMSISMKTISIQSYMHLHIFLSRQSVEKTNDVVSEIFSTIKYMQQVKN